MTTGRDQDMAEDSDDYTSDDVREALLPIASLMSKSEKAQQKVALGTWQHTMLRDNVEALRLASALMDPEAGVAPDAAAVSSAITPADRDAALRALASMIARTEKAQAMFAPGTSQHSLARNRLKALRIAQAFVTREVDEG